MKKRRNRFKQNTTLNQRLAEFGVRLIEEARNTPPGMQRDALIKRVRRTGTALRLNSEFSHPLSERLRSQPQ
jgi:hypothetical protein